MDILNTYVYSLRGPINHTVEAYILPLTSNRLNRHGKLSISAAVALLGLYIMVYNKIMKPPRSLRKLPRVTNPFTCIKALLQNKSAKDISQNLTLPVAIQSPDGVYMRFGAFGWAVHIARPEAAKKMHLKTETFQKQFEFTAPESVLVRLGSNESMLALNGAHWKAQRKVATPAFHRSMPTELFGRQMTKLFNVMDKTIEGGGVSASMDFHNITNRWTLDALGLAGFDFDFNAIADRDNEWVARYSVISDAMFDPFFLIFRFFDLPLLRPFFPKRQKIHQELSIFIQMIDGIISNKRRILGENHFSSIGVKDSEKDLLTLMIEAEEESGGVLSDEELRGNLFLFFIAGHDTTSTALAYAIYYLAVNQDIQKRAREHAINVLGDEQKDIVPTVDQSREMTYINMIIKETLRINPPLNQSTPRAAAQDTEFAGVVIPKGTYIFTEMYEVHHNPTVWDDPDMFKPERFAPGGEAEKIGSAGWQPFMSGPRQCIGMNLSLAEQRVFLPMLLRKYEWSLPEDSIHKNGIVTSGAAIVSPKDLNIVFKRRY